MQPRYAYRIHVADNFQGGGGGNMIVIFVVEALTTNILPTNESALPSTYLYLQLKQQPLIHAIHEVTKYCSTPKYS